MRAIGDERLRPRHASAVREADFAAKKRREADSNRDAIRAIELAICRSLYPKQFGDACELDGWILFHMSDADLGYFADGRDLKKAIAARDRFAADLARENQPV